MARATAGSTQEDRTLTAETIAPQTGAPRAPQAGVDRSDEILSLILTSLNDDKAEDIVTIDLAGKSTVADHMVICSGRSTRQVTALAEKLSDRLKTVLGRSARAEGKGQGASHGTETGRLEKCARSRAVLGSGDGGSEPGASFDPAASPRAARRGRPGRAATPRCAWG